MPSLPLPHESPRRILIVDDVPDLLSVLARQLAREGFATTICSTIEEALDALAQATYCAALVDLYFGMQPAGMELLTAIRSDPRTANMPLVSMSGSGEHELRRSLACGADAFVAKPFTLPEFRDALDRAVTARQR